MKIVILDGKTVSDGGLKLEVFEEFGELVIYQLTSPEEVVERIWDADIILCNKVELNESNLSYAKKLKFIGLFATGYNNIDTEYCAKRNIVVANAGSYSTEAVAQHTFALILNHYNSIHKYVEYVAKGEWMKQDTFAVFSYPMHELQGKTIGIIGAGAIGSEVARIAEAFHMKVMTYTRKNTKEEFEEILRKADIITLHCPLNQESKGMFHKEVFAKCEKKPYFVNTARGGVVVEQDLADALNLGQLSGAAIDVLIEEPMSKDCVLFGAKNITFTPHVGWAPEETRGRLIKIVQENIRSFLRGEPKNQVN